MNKLLFLLNILVVLALVFGYLSSVVSPDSTWFFSVFGLFFPIIALANFIFIGIWIFRKPNYIWLSLIPVLIGASSMNKLIQLHGNVKDNDGVKIMTYNIRGNNLFYGKTKEAKNQKIAAFADFLKRNNDVEIICFQEEGASTTKKIKELLKDYKTPVEKYRGTNVYTKLPILDHGNIRLESYAHNAFWVDLLMSGDTVRLYNVHLSSNRISNKTDHLIEEHDLSEKETWSDIKYVLSKYAHHAKKRMDQLELVLKHVKASPHPVIICGDFNDVPQSYIYSMASQNMTDSFIKKGNNLGATYTLNFPPLRIDYIFVDPSFEVSDHQVLKEKMSDHYPVIGSIRLIN